MIKDISGFEIYEKDEYQKSKLDIRKNVYTPNEKQKMFRAKLLELRNIFSKIDDVNKLKIADDVIVSVARCAVELRNLEEVIRYNGHVEEYRNGAKQSGLKKSAASDAYCSLKKTCLADINFLINLLSAPESDGKKISSSELLDTFVKMKDDT